MALNGNTAVVTGGASGIGAACCRELANQGARVVVVDRAEDRARAVAEGLGGLAKTLDVGNPDQIASVSREIESEAGPVDILVNSAGIIQLPLPPHELSLQLWDEVVRINQRGTYLMCVAFGTRMAAARSGSIVNIASIAGMRSMPLHAYSPASRQSSRARSSAARGIRAGWRATPPLDAWLSPKRSLPSWLFSAVRRHRQSQGRTSRSTAVRLLQCHGIPMAE